MTKRKLNKKRKKGITPNKVAIIGTIITMIGGFLISYNYVQAKKVVAYDYMSNVFYNEDNAKKIKNQIEEEEKEKEEIKEELPETYNDDYIGYLTIPKINLTKGFVDKRSKENDVEKNILVVEGSNYPNVKKGNLILAGHSGTGWKAFFNDLQQLTNGDVIYVSYKGKKYQYKIVNIYKQSKVGRIAIYRNYDKTTLTLVTCTNNDNTTQTIYISELESVEEE
ncbi:MAG: sortase [Firmicutes bacterium]|nr:sortase [Bacillota bacterium]